VNNCALTLALQNVLYLLFLCAHLSIMEIISEHDAIRMMEDVSKLPDGNFNIAFYKYSRSTGIVDKSLCTKKHCRSRLQLPHEKWDVDGDNYFLFTDGDGKPKQCYKILIRYISLSTDGYTLRKVERFK